MSNLIEAKDLMAIFNSPNTVIFDASWFMPAENRDPNTEFVEEHIPGAQRFDFEKEVKNQTSDLPHMLPTSEAFQAIARDMGVDNDNTIVVYETGPMFAAPRVWWMFKVMGHDNVAVLNGGLKAWKEADGPTEQGEAPRPSSQGDFVASLEESRISTAEEVLNKIQSTTKIVDARGEERFEGRVPEPRAGLRAGHIPGSVNLPYNLFVKDGAMRSTEEIERQWQAKGVDKDEEIIASCGTGVTASVLALAAEVAGFKPVSVYDGSWSEWGQESRQDLPIETGKAKKV